MRIKEPVKELGYPWESVSPLLTRFVAWFENFNPRDVEDGSSTHVNDFFLTKQDRSCIVYPTRLTHTQDRLVDFAHPTSLHWG